MDRVSMLDETLLVEEPVGRQEDLAVHVRHDGARWALRTDGTNGSAKTFDTKREAVTAARQEAAAAAPSRWPAPSS